MTSLMVRGYCVAKAADFVQNQYDANARQRIEQGFSFELRKALAEIQAAKWYPREYLIDVIRAVAEARDQSSAHDDLIRCGRFMAEQENNEFMRLAMKLLTPELLVKKLPRLWQRDYRTGRLEVEISASEEKRATLRLNDVGGFDHIALTWLGWMKALFIELCGPGVQLTQHGWSTREPAPKSVQYEVIWP